MDARDAFGVVVRGAGLLLLVGWLASHAVTAAFGALDTDVANQLFSVAWFGLGLSLLRGARVVVAFAYPGDARPSS